MTDEARLARNGFLAGMASYVVWGLLPVYMKLLNGVPATQVVAHRILWSLALLAVVLTLARRWRPFVAAARQPRMVGALFASAAFVATNWLIYMWSVQHDRVIEASLGYFINPLVSVLLGVIVLRERLRAPQWTALAIAGVGVAVLAIASGGSLVIPLGLAFSFGLYGLVRKLAPVDALTGLTIETALLAPFALAWLVVAHRAGEGGFGASPMVDGLLIFTGPLTAAPLLLFAVAARRLSLSTLGVIQYVAPTLQFFQAVLLFNEALTTVRLICFGCIWVALAIYAVDGWRASRQAATKVAATEPT